jgi:hypothetical protein
MCQKQLDNYRVAPSHNIMQEYLLDVSATRQQ